MPEQTTAWQPIATAPRDGTEVLLFDPDQGRHVGAWATDWGGPDTWFVTVSSHEFRLDPTLWMQLPESPI